MRKHILIFEDFNIQTDLEKELKELEYEVGKAISFSQKIPLLKKIEDIKSKLGIPTIAEINQKRNDALKIKQEEDTAYVLSQINKFDKGEIKIDVYNFGMHNGPTKPFKVKLPLYRGQQTWEENNDNKGMAVYGNGLYTTPSKKYASSYGKVQEVDPEIAMPNNPLYFNSMLDFNQFEYSFSAELFKDRKITDRRNLYIGKYGNIDKYLTKLGFDGVIIRYHDAHTVVVKYI